jgi:hypothetical protein
MTIFFHCKFLHCNFPHGILQKAKGIQVFRSRLLESQRFLAPDASFTWWLLPGKYRMSLESERRHRKLRFLSWAKKGYAASCSPRK